MNLNDLDLNFYILMNNDIASKLNFDKNEIKDYFMTTQNDEKRIFSKEHSKLFLDHDWNEYLNNNIDIRNKNINSEILSFKHYINYGKNEKRKIYSKNIQNQIKNDNNNVNFDKVINFIFCRNFYPFLSNKTNFEILNYINKNKSKTDLVYSDHHSYLFTSYDWNMYINKNNDLKINKINNVQSAFIHFIQYGQYENRKIYKKYTQEKKIEEPSSSQEKKNEELPSSQEKKNKELPSSDELIINDNYENTSNNILKEFNNNNIDHVYKLLENNLIIQSNYLNLPFSNKIDERSYDFMNNNNLWYFDHNYYYKLNKNYYKLDNDPIFLLNHYLNEGMKKYLPFNKNHYLIYINSDWELYKKENNILEEDNYNLLINYLKINVYMNKNIKLESKYNYYDFINTFYNELNNTNNNIKINYYLFLNDENDKKFFPDIFNYFIYNIIDWNSFKKDNKLNFLKDECFHYFLKNIDDMNHLKITFLNINDINLDIDLLVKHSKFKPFILEIFNYITKDTNDLYESNLLFNQIFNYKVLEIPNDFKIEKKNDKYSSIKINIFIHYLNNYDNLYNLLNSIFLQSHKNIKIIILNIIDDKLLTDKINELKKINILSGIEIAIIDIIDIKDIQLNNYIDYHDLNLIINDNYFFKNNNILNSLIDFNNKSYNKIIINKNVYLNELNNFCIINSNDLLNNTHLLINYYIIESSIIFNDHSILIENKININQKKNINIYNQIYKDFEKNNTFKISYPIYIFNNNKSLKEIKPSYFYKNIYLEDKYTFDNYLRSLKEINQYQYIIIIQMNKIKNFNNIHFEEIKEKLSNDLIPIYYKTKRKNCLNISDKFINIKNNEAFLCSKRLLTDYINHKLYPL